MITMLEIYFANNYLEINVDKTKGMVFNKSGRFYRNMYKLGNCFIPTTNSYKYIGFIFTPSGEIHSGLKDFNDRALRAHCKLKQGLGQFLNYSSRQQSFYLFIYAADFWGCLKLPRNSPIENVHLRFCKTPFRGAKTNN